MASLAARTDQNAASFLVNSMAETTSVDEANEMAQLQQQHNTNSLGDESQGCAEKLTGEITGAPEDGHNGLAVAEEEPVIDIVINNVVSSFNTRCHLNLKQIATEGTNVEYKRANGMLNMKIRHPYTTASMWSSGKVTCTGATSEADAHIAARRFARKIQLLGFDVRFCNFRVVNVLATCSLPFGIKITNFSRDHPQSASYEPELHPGVTYKIKSPKATLKIFSTGSITVTAPCVANVQTAIEHIFPLVYEYKSMELHSRGAPKFVKKSRVGGQKAPVMYTEKSDNFINDSDEFSDSDASFDSEESHD